MRLYRKSGVRRRSSLTAILATAAGLALPSAALAVSDQFVFYFNNSVSLQGGTGALGGFSYDSTNNVFYTLGFLGSTQGIYKDTESGSTWSSSLQINNLTSGTNDWTKFAISTSNAGNGSILAGATATPTIGDMLLNPASLTLGTGINAITYAPGTLGIIIDAGKTTVGGVANPSVSKLVYAYDLRAVTYDPNTLAENDPAAPGTRDWNGDGIVEWNDVFTPIVSLADQQAAVGGTTSTVNNVARRFAFSTDGQSIYYDDTSSVFGGIYKVKLTQTGNSAISRIVSSTNGTTIFSEPWVVPTSTRDFGAGAGAGDQVIFQASTDTGNLGGLNYVVDTGSSVSASKVLLSAKQLNWFLDAPTGGAVALNSISADSSGNVYIENGGNYGGVFEYDTQGRLVKIFSGAEQRAFEYGLSPAVAYSASTLEFKVTTATVTYPSGSATINQLLYRDVGLKAPVGVNVYLPGDFNRDGIVDQNDVNLFKTHIGLRGAVSGSIATTTGSVPTNGANFIYDLNGSVTSTTANVSVDWKDVKILQQFAGFSDADVNLDGSVTNADLTTLAGNYSLDNKIWTDGKLSSVRVNAADANKVGFVDLVTLAASWPLAKPLLGTLGLIPQTDLDRAFAITAGGTISQLTNTKGGALTWSTSGIWSGSVVPNGAGAVVSLLNKPTNDIALNVDASYTMGQLNFDNFFTYTLSGTGMLHLAGNNGTSAEINTFDASPNISAALSLDSPTSITVNEAIDTLTLGGAVTGSGNLTKLGSGTLLLSGNNSYRGSTTISAGVLEASKAAALPGYGVTGKVSVAAAATLAVNAAGAAQWYSTELDTLRANVSFGAGSIFAIDTSGNTGGFVYPSNIGPGIPGLVKIGANTLVLSGTNTYSGGTTVSAGTLQASKPASLSGYTSAGQVLVASGATLAVNAGGAGEWTSTNIDALRSNATIPAGAALAIDTTSGGFIYASSVAGALGITKLGANSLTLTGTNTYTGTTTISGGTLALDFTAGPATNIINSSANTSNLATGSTNGANSALTLLGRSSTTDSQRFNGITLNPGSASVTLSANGGSNPLSLNLGSFTRNVGSTINFTLPTGAQSTTNGVVTSSSTATLGGFATIGQTDFVAVTSTVAGVVTYTADTWASANNTNVTNNDAPAAASTTNSLRFNATGAFTVTLSGINTITTGGILDTANVGNNISAITGGTLLGGSGKDLIVHQYNTNNVLSIGSIIADNGLATGLTKTGGGNLTLTGANTYTGPNWINAGTLEIASTGSIVSTPMNILSAANATIDSGGTISALTDLTDNGTFNSNSPVCTLNTLNGAGQVNLNSSTLTVNNGGVFSGVIADSGVGGLTVGGSTLLLSGTNLYSGNTNVNSGTLIVGAGGALASANVNVAAGAILNVNGTLNNTPNVSASGVVNFAASGGGFLNRTLNTLTIGSTGNVNVSDPVIANHTNRNVLAVSSLVFSSPTSGTLNLASNDMVVRNSSPAAGLLAQAAIFNELKSGFNQSGGYWNGTAGIISTGAAANTAYLTTLGYRISDGTMFDNQATTANNDVEIKYTYYGDADLNGVVNGADYQQIDMGFGSGGTVWSSGDFNYDGVVDGSDYALIDNTFNQVNAISASPLSLLSNLVATPADLSAVPEPTSLGLVAVTSLVLFARRTRKSRRKIETRV